MSCMHKYLVLTVLFIQSSTALFRVFENITAMNNMPDSYPLTADGKPLRIAILNLPVPGRFWAKLEKKFKAAQKAKEDELNYYDSRNYITGSYVKWLRSNNIEVVVIDYDINNDQIAKIMETTNGLILQGGLLEIYKITSKIEVDSIGMRETKNYFLSEFYQRTKFILDKAKQINQTRTFAIWGACLNLEAVLAVDSNHSMRFDYIHNVLHNTHIHVEENTQFSQFLDQYPGLKDNLNNKINSFFSHNYGFLKSTFSNSQLPGLYYLLATSRNRKGKELVALVENKQYPFILSQFHVEKNPYELNHTIGTDESPEAKYASARILEYFMGKFDRWRYNPEEYEHHDEVASLVSFSKITEMGPLSTFDTFIFFKK